MTDAPAAEVLGPPGAGKSTVLAAVARTPGVVVVGGFRGREAGPVHRLGAGAGAVVAAAPWALAELGGPAPWPQAPGDDPGSRTDRARWVLRLAAAPAVLAAERAGGARAVVFDQGPAYTLVRLHPAGRPGGGTAPAAVTRRWEAQVERWAGLLDLVVVLDAPDDVLLARIDARTKDHALRGASATAARAALAGHRRRCTAVAEALTGPASGPRLLRLDTGPSTASSAASSATPEGVAAAVTGALAGLGAAAGRDGTGTSAGAA